MYVLHIHLSTVAQFVQNFAMQLRLRLDDHLLCLIRIILIIIMLYALFTQWRLFQNRQVFLILCLYKNTP